MKQYYTYIHLRNDTKEPFYIGKGCDNRHLDTKKRNTYWKRVYAKAGRTSEILAYWDTEQEAWEHERFLIACFRDMGYQLANATDGGDGFMGKLFPELEKKRIEKIKSKETKALTSKNVKKAMATPEVQAKLSAAQKKRMANPENNPAYLGPIMAINIVTGEQLIFKGVKELKAAGYQQPNVSKCLNGTRQSHKGYTWKRITTI